MTMSNADAAPRTRRTRSDGERSRAAILRAASQLATTRGIERLSIAELAAHIGMSKSGLYAHFGSKEELQLATIDAAEALFDDVVVGPMSSARPGVPAIIALSDAFLDHLRQRVFPGGCFFASVSAEIHATPGRVKDRIAEFDVRWRAHFRENLATARDTGQIARNADVDQLVFDLDAYLAYAHAAFSFRGTPEVLDRAARAVRERLASAA